jgi:ferric-dicitrate binding protein FerR (iron transport regulator)
MTTVKLLTAILLLNSSLTLGQKVVTFTSSSSKTKKIALPDGSEVWLNVKSTLKLAPDFNGKTRTVNLSGDAFFKIKSSKSKPFIIKTAQLVLTTYAASLRVDAYPSPGEEADVLTGTVRARKSYHSTLDNGQYDLGPGQMVMINREIDLIEKEKFDSTQLKTWLNRFK